LRHCIDTLRRAVNEALLSWLMVPNSAELRSVTEVLARPRWMTAAACRGAGVAEFVMDAKRTPSEAVQAMCGRCPVREECIAYALERDVLVGIWGGTTELERRAMRRTVA